MPNLKYLLKKKDSITHEGQALSPRTTAPKITTIHSPTDSQGLIRPPTYFIDPAHERKQSKRALQFRRSSHPLDAKDSSAAPASPTTTAKASLRSPIWSKGERLLSEKLQFYKRDWSRSGPTKPSSNLPQGLPEAPEAVRARSKSGAIGDDEKDAKERREAQWEKRATMLVMNSPLREEAGQELLDSPLQTQPESRILSEFAKGEVNIQEAIRLHEEGDLAGSTDMFGQLANPQGDNNALAQVLYGLALRHGWGVDIEPERALYYLQLAASNSASIEEHALSSGLNGGAAKGELVLAIFELANCFRHGWGVQKDAVAARQYYETAANLGDTDAMEEAAWCYLEGFGGGKNKVKAAQYLRVAEEKGAKRVGNSWIWKEKYNDSK